MSFLDYLSVTKSPWNVCRMSSGGQQWPRVSLRRRKGTKTTVNSFLPTEGSNRPLTVTSEPQSEVCAVMLQWHENPTWANISEGAGTGVGLIRFHLSPANCKNIWVNRWFTKSQFYMSTISFVGINGVAWQEPVIDIHPDFRKKIHTTPSWFL